MKKIYVSIAIVLILTLLVGVGIGIKVGLAGSENLSISEETETVEIQTVNTMDEEVPIEAQTTVQNPNPNEPAFEFIDLVARSTSFGSKNTGVGCNASGVPVERCLEIVFDFPEELRSDYTTSISCSWDHVVNGTYGRRERMTLLSKDHNLQRYSWEVHM